MSDRVYNFSPGPSALPLAVLQKAQEELLNYAQLGISVMEMSHRSEAFFSILKKAQDGIRRLLHVPEDFEILFLQGGATFQFTMVPLNLLIPGRPPDVLHTGYWTMKAVNELKKFGGFSLLASSEDQGFTQIPSVPKGNPDASYVYMVTNNTIYGTQWSELPDVGEVPLVADMTSDIFSRPIDFSRGGLFFASAQKNAGIAGVTLVLIRKDLADRCPEDLGSYLQYRTHIKSQSLYNTPPTFAIYLTSLMVEWMENAGGVAEFQKRSEKKSKILYELIDSSEFYQNSINESDRSKMNVIFQIGNGDNKLENLFVEEAKESGFIGVKGHRVTGGMRISLYNSITVEAVEKLAEFMTQFQKKHQK